MERGKEVAGSDEQTSRRDATDISPVTGKMGARVMTESRLAGEGPCGRDEQSVGRKRASKRRDRTART